MKKFLFVVVLAFAGLFATANSKAVTHKSIELQSNMMLAKEGSVVKDQQWYYLGVYDVYVDGVYIGTYDVYMWA